LCFADCSDIRRNQIRYRKKQAEALEKAVFQVIPGISKTKTFQLNPDQTLSEMTNNDPKLQKVYAGYDEKGCSKVWHFREVEKDMVIC
jgi:hypothetical protein